jgi:hypothetical protein
VPDLLAVKREGTEEQAIRDVARYEEDWPLLEARLETARRESALPDVSANADALSEFVVEERRRNF